MARIAVLGLWHLGCVVSAALASLGHEVKGTDPDPQIVSDLSLRKPPVYEPGLTEMMAQQVKEGRLSFVAWGGEALSNADFACITIDTPVGRDGQSDLSPVENALDLIARSGKRDLGVVLMTQVPVGTCQRLDAQLRKRAPGSSFTFVYQPENLRLGDALRTFLGPDMIVLGAQDRKAAGRFLQLYEGVQAPCLVMSWSSAEMFKHAVNAFLATSISFANELADLAEEGGADIRDIVRALRLDSRIGPHAFLNPGPGFASGTLARDIQTLRSLGETHDCPTPQLDATLAVNSARLPGIVRKIECLCGKTKGLQVGILGLTYKPGSSTLRRSNALGLARLLLEQGCHVRAFDPRVVRPEPELEGVTLCSTAYQAAEHSDVLVVMTPWPDIKDLDFSRLRSALRQPVLIDAHNSLDARRVQKAGLRYVGTGVAEDRSLRTVEV